MSSSSSDSDAVEQVKNIHSLMIKSKVTRSEGTGHAYKRRLGDLIFNSSFESGNLGYVEQIDQFEYDMMIRPDISNPRHRLWFNFTVSNQRLGQVSNGFHKNSIQATSNCPIKCVIFTFVNFSETIKLFQEGLTPVVRSRQNANWTRLNEDQVFYYKSNSHGGRYVLSLAFRFSSYEDEHQFALFYPYSYSNLMAFLDRWLVEIKRKANREINSTRIVPVQHPLTPEIGIRRSRISTSSAHQERSKSSLGFHQQAKGRTHKLDEPIMAIEVLGTSNLCKKIYHISIGPPAVSHWSVLILCRTSRGNLDGAASLICQGVMDFLLSEHLVAKEVQARTGVHVIPMLDPDSICAGNSRSDIFGQLLGPSPINHSCAASLYSSRGKICDLATKLCAQSAYVILIELIVNLNLVGARITGTLFDDSIRMERHLHLPRLMSQFADGFQLENCEFVKDPENWINQLR